MRLFLALAICTTIAPILRAQTSAAGDTYFQQHVHYTLDATMHDDRTYPWLSGTGTLEYTNNSPDTLRDLYFHLYWNVFKGDKYGEHDELHDSTSKIGPKGIVLTRLTIGDQQARYEVDNTIMRVFLDRPILPGQTTNIAFDWNALIPHFGMRTTWGWHDEVARNFAEAQWYPQICVYDNHGWHPDQYIGMGEFYTDYGAFDVTLTLPQRFTTVMATGWLENPEETLPESVRDNLAFAKSHPDSIVHIADNSNYAYHDITANEPMRTWKFHADSVRDFAWSADEAYIWDAVYDGGVMHHAVYWKESRDFWSREGAKIVLVTEQTNSAFAGKYAYPNMVLSETYEGGMEYPGIVFVGPSEHESTYHWQYNTMMHELGHEWYPMMMGSNETDYGYMDEGFNTFITTFVQERYFGRWNNSYGPGLGFNDDERTANYRASIMQQLVGNQEPSKQKADAYLSYRDYAEATYPHTSSVFFMLRYTMGDKPFDDFMHLYYQRWRFKHPYPDDLLDAAEEIERREGDTNRVRARGDLRWFFNEWFEQTWQLDYAVGDFDVDGNTATVTIEKKQRAVMPLDLVFTFADGTTERKWIPVDDWLRTMSKERTYTFTFDKQPVKVEINPTRELLDVNRLNNTSRWIPPTHVSLIPKIYGDIKPIDEYAIRSAPYVAPLTADFSHGWLIGWTFLGSYLDRTDRIAIGPRIGLPHPGDAEIGGAFQYHSVLDMFSPFSDIDILLAQSDSNAYYGFRYSHVIDAPGTTDPAHIIEAGYDLSGDVWNSRKSGSAPLNRGYFGYTLHADMGWNTLVIAGEGEDGLGDPRTTYTKLAGMIDDRVDISDNWNAFLRLFGGSMQPIGKPLPTESLFQLSSPDDVDHFSDLYGSNFGSGVRDKIRNAAMSGPLVRGYFGQNNVYGRVAASGTFELGTRTIPGLNEVPFGLVLFGDAGLVTDAFCTCNLKSEMKSDAGLGFRFFGFGGRPIQAWDLDLGRTELQFDFPLYLDRPAAGEKNLAFRFIAMVRQDF